MFRIFRIFIEFPALDRLMDYLEAARQKELDDLAAQLNQSSDGLAAVIKENK